MTIKKSYHIKINPVLIAIAERLAKSKSDAIHQALQMFISAPEKDIIVHSMPIDFARKHSYHVSIDPDLINAAQRLAKSKAEAIHRALKMFVKAHKKAVNGQHTEKVNGQSLTVGQEKLIEFKKKLQKERQKEIEYYDRSIKVLEANVKTLKESVAEIPKIFEAVERITPALVQKIEGCRSEITLRDIKIDDTAKGLENVEDTVKRMLTHRSQEVENSISLNDIKSRVDGEVGRLKIAEGKINTLERKEEIRARAEAEAKAKNNVPGGPYDR